MTQATADTRPIASAEDAEAYVAMVCFKHGPPRLTGVELEWTVHHREAAERPLDPQVLASALGEHAPTSIAPLSPHLPLPHGSLVTVEPGGQVEISSAPCSSLQELLTAVNGDIAALDALLLPRGLRRGTSGIDTHRSPVRLLEVPRYATMQRFFEGRGPWGSAMMCSTASNQVCLDAGEAIDAPLRWRTLHSVGPALVALFANSPVARGVRTGWASNRLRATLGACPPFTHPLDGRRDPAASWVQRVMAAPVMCVRRAREDWTPERPMSFAAWVSGAAAGRPTYDDLAYHLTTLFPPVRPKGYVEVRYLDAQPDGMWHHPAVMLAALLSSTDVAERACEVTEGSTNLWLTAARSGLADRRLRTAAHRLVELAAEHLDPGLGPDQAEEVVETLGHRTSPHAARRQTA